MLRSRRRPHYATHLCALSAAVLLLLSVSILYIRLTSHHPPHPHHQHPDLTSNPLLGLVQTTSFWMIMMFKSNLEMLNPMSNPFLQDPDGAGVTGLTKGDKMIQKRIVNEFKKVPFGVSVTSVDNPMSKTKVESENKVAERRTLDEGIREVVDKSDEMRNEFSGQIYADGKRWGYFPGLHPRLSFSNFMDAFFRKGKCSMRVFMVWNSPPWMFTVRHQRGLESLLFHHPDACVVVFSETLELNFFDSFVKDGFKVAVAMPNLDELLKDTPTHEFASVWFEWRKTKFYPTHYSELIRLAALYKYGGIYLDSDVIVIKPLYSLSNMVGLEDESSASDLNGAVMVFRKHSPFIMECLKEFYASYDDTNLRWNGADLLTRVGSKFLHEENGFKNQMELKLQPFFAFFPISRKSLTRYFTQPTTDAEKADQDALYQKIVDEALVFHFWNSLTSSLVPEAGSLAARLIDRHCIRCSDML
ncbi:putative glycosyltransferase, DXD sugar-binding, alpha 1,4-glycosyltransferase [Helianthus annuus]|nr:putative glycosyltransferase, DXD sugar-binding, alpha 1,4-glycosyltransferase [Helianthus annuus]